MSDIDEMVEEAYVLNEELEELRAVLADRERQIKTLERQNRALRRKNLILAQVAKLDELRYEKSTR